MYSLTIFSKNKNSLKSFLLFISRINKTHLTNIQNLPIRKKKHFLTVLKSPHVNKTAQEQFEFKIYHKTIIIQSFRNYKFLALLFKKIIKTRFPDVKVQFSSTISQSYNQRFILKSLNPCNLNIKFFEPINIKSLRNPLVLKYSNLLDVFGERFLTFDSV